MKLLQHQVYSFFSYRRYIKYLEKHELITHKMDYSDQRMVKCYVCRTSHFRSCYLTRQGYIFKKENRFENSTLFTIILSVLHIYVSV